MRHIFIASVLAASSAFAGPADPDGPSFPCVVHQQDAPVVISASSLVFVIPWHEWHSLLTKEQVKECYLDDQRSKQLQDQCRRLHERVEGLGITVMTVRSQDALLHFVAGGKRQHSVDLRDYQGHSGWQGTVLYCLGTEPEVRPSQTASSSTWPPRLDPSADQDLLERVATCGAGLE